MTGIDRQVVKFFLLGLAVLMLAGGLTACGKRGDSTAHPKSPLNPDTAMTGFLRKDGMLTVDGLDLEKSLAADWGTPVYIYSAAAIEERFRHFRDTVAPATGKVHYAIKVNSNPRRAAASARPGAGADIVSAGEMQRALKAGFAAADIVFSGVGKTDMILLQPSRPG